MIADPLSALRAGKDVHLWLRRLDLDAAPSPDEIGTLGPHERERASRLLREVDRRRFIRRHLHLREVLARCLGTAPDRVPLDATLHQRPRLTDGTVANDLRLSLSSSRDRSAVAIAWRRPVGVDIERIDPAIDLTAVAATVFSNTERQALKTVSDSERPACFFRIWARKEAFVKAKGTGLSRDLMSFDAMRPDGHGAGGEALVIDRDADADAGEPGWLVRDVHGPSDFALACCAEGDDWSIVRHEEGA